LSSRFFGQSRGKPVCRSFFSPAATKKTKWWGHLFCIIVGFFDRHLSNSIATCWCIWRRRLRRKAPTYRAHLRRLPFCLHVLVALSKGWVVIQSNISPPKHESTFTSQKHAKTRVLDTWGKFWFLLSFKHLSRHQCTVNIQTWSKDPKIAMVFTGLCHALRNTKQEREEKQNMPDEHWRDSGWGTFFGAKTG
jgi:hypothetical protein